MATRSRRVHKQAVLRVVQIVARHAKSLKTSEPHAETSLRGEVVGNLEKSLTIFEADLIRLEGREDKCVCRVEWSIGD